MVGQRRLRRRVEARRPCGWNSCDVPDVRQAQTLHDFGEGCAFYINLARRPDRVESLMRTLSVANSELLAGIRRIDAVDGRDMRLHFDSGLVWSIADPAAVARGMRAERIGLYTVVHHGQDILHFNDHLTDGAIACAMSHRLALQAAAAHPTADWALILEDDVAAVVPRLDEAIAGVLRKLPADWDAVFLGYHDKCGGLAQVAYGGVADVPVARMVSHDYGLFAWIVRKEVAQMLVDHAFPISGQVDKAITSWLVRERCRSYKVAAQSMLFYSPKSEESQDSDVQSLGSIDRLVEEHGSVDLYNSYLTAERENFGHR